MTSEVEQLHVQQKRLRDRAFSAGVWTLSSYGAALAVRLVSNLVLSRLLFPEAFGAMTAAMALIVGLSLISDFGVRAVIVQSPHGDDVAFLRSAWVFQLWRGIAVWLILVIFCLLMSTAMMRAFFPGHSVFADPQLPWITAAMGFSLVLAGAESTSISWSMRHLNYKRIAWVDLISKILSLPLMLVWAWLSSSVWALVVGIVAASFFRTLLSHIWVSGPRMAFEWRKEHIQEITHFGRWIVVSSFASFISLQSDVILLGLFTSGSTLGLYSIAKLLSGTADALLDQLTSALALPVLGEVVRKNPADLRNRYYRFRLPIDVIAGLLSGALFVSGHFVITFLYDVRYEQAGLMLQILALGIATYPFSIIANAFTAIGDTHIFALNSSVRAISLFMSVVVGFFAFGLLGAIAGAALHKVLPSVVIMLLAYQRNWISIWKEVRILPLFVIGALVGKGAVAMSALFGIENIHQFLSLVRLR